MKLVKLSIVIAFFFLSRMPASAQSVQLLDSLNRLLSASQPYTNLLKQHQLCKTYSKCDVAFS
jgi:hypothetical protein